LSLDTLIVARAEHLPANFTLYYPYGQRRRIEGCIEVFRTTMNELVAYCKIKQPRNMLVWWGSLAPTEVSFAKVTLRSRSSAFLTVFVVLILVSFGSVEFSATFLFTLLSKRTPDADLILRVVPQYPRDL
jgi:hypothetical protein